ncbi:OmpA family protein [Vreelandella nanhaiensis]|uniref:Flagellar motor protein MotB n=1 Tax=Vreelandella nanhaiensis TaxID=1258546 RepID=A0A433KRT1_9GAMM|nr:OmpA family protein [Halomonas nanhaiensis]RUR32292.1 flagellar motor protein MotB [Halomonas nanhaiensis]
MLEDHRGGSRHDSLMSAYPSDESGSGWMISYIDIMTLLVALFVIIIAAAGATKAEIFQASSEQASSEEIVQEAGPVFEVPLPEVMESAMRQPVLEAWRRGLEPSAVSVALGVAGLPKQNPLPDVPPPLLALARFGSPPPVEVDEPLAWLPPVALPTPLIPVRNSASTTPLANYMVLLTDHPPVNVQEISIDAINSAEAIQEALVERVETSPYLPNLEGVEVTRVAEGISLRVQDQLLFPSAAAELTSGGSSLVGSLLETIQRYEGEVWVEGHSDSQTISTNEFSSNWALSSARAIAIVEALEAEGVAPERLRAVGLAATQPLEDNSTPEGRARNRRVEVVIHIE